MFGCHLFVSKSTINREVLCKQSIDDKNKNAGR